MNGVVSSHFLILEHNDATTGRKVGCGGEEGNPEQMASLPKQINGSYIFQK